jgi:glycerol-3-phosphate acyltransferase PlsY
MENGRAVCGILGGVCSVLGHVYPVWLRFQGGKGVATSAGAICALMPLAALVMAVVWIVTFEITRYVSLASVTAAISLPVAVGALLYLKQLSTPALLYFSIVVAAIVVIRHRSNLSRWRSGTEQRFRRK